MLDVIAPMLLAAAVMVGLIKLVRWVQKNHKPITKDPEVRGRHERERLAQRFNEIVQPLIKKKRDDD